MVEQPSSSQVESQPYSEEQATQWLAWLAYQMQQHDKTIFQIEDLQPSWLVYRTEVIYHLLLTRLTWGILGGFIFATLTGEEITFMLGFCVGLGGGLSEIVLPLQKLDFRLKSYVGSTKAVLLGTILFGAIAGLVGGLIFGLAFGLINDKRIGINSGIFIGLTIGLIVGLLFGLIRTTRVILRKSGKQIQTVESLVWSWNHARMSTIRGLTFGLTFGIVFGLISGIVYGLSEGMIYGLRIGAISGLSFWLFFGAVGGLIGGLQPRPQDLKMYPNQGLWLTIRSAIKVGLQLGLILGFVPKILLGGFSFNLNIEIVAITSLAITVALWYGGLDALEHGIIRLILWRRGHAPLNYATFLDYAADELNFLQKVGGAMSLSIAICWSTLRRLRLRKDM